MPSVIAIEFYTKPDCPLCEDASSLLEVASHHWPLEVRTVNILTDRTLYDLYWNRIPVLEFDNGSTLEAPITREKLAGFLRRIREVDGSET
jgi:glutaredoxin